MRFDGGSFLCLPFVILILVLWFKNNSKTITITITKFKSEWNILQEGYDYKIGIAQTGQDVMKSQDSLPKSFKLAFCLFCLFCLHFFFFYFCFLLTNIDTRFFRHLLIVFGGINGIEESILADPALEETRPNELFDICLNTCPDSGSRSVRTEVCWSRPIHILTTRYLDNFKELTTFVLFIAFSSFAVLFYALLQESILISLAALQPWLANV